MAGVVSARAGVVMLPIQEPTVRTGADDGIHVDQLGQDN